MDNKLKFSLVPISGTLKGRGGYRAKFGKRHRDVMDLDDVIQEARTEGAFFGVGDELVKLIIRGVLQNMIDKTAKDGITRRIDDYLSVSLKVRGKFDEPDEDFDPKKHKLALSLKPLVAFRPDFKLQPVNVDHKRQFRIYSISAADGSRKSGQVVWGKDIRIKGGDLVQEVGKTVVACQMQGSDGAYLSANPEIVSITSSEIVCHWPTEYGEGYKSGTMEINVCTFNTASDPSDLPSRGKRVVVLPE